MRVLIVNPPWESSRGYGARSNCRWPHIEDTPFTHFPVYLGYTAAVLRQAGVEVQVLDCAAGNLSSAGMLAALPREPVDLCLVETSTPSINQDLANAARLKANGAARVVLMGAHASVFASEILQQHAAVDGIITGEFDLVAAELCSRPWAEVAGLAFRQGGVAVLNPPRSELADLDSLPFPAWDLFPLAHYDWALLPSPAMLMIATRGCPFHCSYCLWPSVMYGHVQRRRSPGNVVDEIEELVRCYRVRGIRFDDDTFALNSGYVAGICEEILARGIERQVTWSCFGHTAAVDRDLYELMRRAGCAQIDFGVETGSGAVLEDIHKGTKIENTRRAIAVCRSLGIRTYGTFMIGFPEESEEDIRRTMRLAMELDPDFMQVSYVIPYPGTPLYQECEQKGYLPYGSDWEQYDATRPVIINRVPAPVLEKLYRRFWARFFLRPRFAWYFLVKALTSWRDLAKALHGVRYILGKLF